MGWSTTALSVAENFCSVAFLRAAKDYFSESREGTIQGDAIDELRSLAQKIGQDPRVVTCITTCAIASDPAPTTQHDLMLLLPRLQSAALQSFDLDETVKIAIANETYRSLARLAGLSTTISREVPLTPFALPRSLDHEYSRQFLPVLTRRGVPLSENIKAQESTVETALRNAQSRRRVYPHAAHDKLITLRSEAPPATLMIHDIQAALSSLEGTLNCKITIVGGGYGCFELDVAVQLQDASGGIALERITDEALIPLRAAGITSLEIREDNDKYVFNDVHEVRVGVLSTHPDCIREAVRDGRTLRGAVSEVAAIAYVDIIRDAGPGTDTSSRWKRYSQQVFNLGFKRSMPEPHISHLTIMDDIEQLSLAVQRKQAHVFVHGFLNSFEDSLSACALLAHRAKAEASGSATILFSWDAGSSAFDYASLTQRALTQRTSFGNLVRALHEGSAGRVVLTAHSHGNIVAMEVLRDLAASEPMLLKTLELLSLAPDVNTSLYQNYLVDVEPHIGMMVMYVNEYDLALRVSEIIGGRSKAGTGDFMPNGTGAAVFIDTSNAGGDAIGHSYFSTVSEMIYDISAHLAGTDFSRRPWLTPLLGRGRQCYRLTRA